MPSLSHTHTHAHITNTCITGEGSVEWEGKNTLTDQISHVTSTTDSSRNCFVTKWKQNTHIGPSPNIHTRSVLPLDADRFFMRPGLPVLELPVSRCSCCDRLDARDREGTGMGAEEPPERWAGGGEGAGEAGLGRRGEEDCGWVGERCRSSLRKVTLPSSAWSLTGRTEVCTLSLQKQHADMTYSVWPICTDNTAIQCDACRRNLFSVTDIYTQHT